MLATVLVVRVAAGVIHAPPFLWETQTVVIVKERRPVPTFTSMLLGNKAKIA